MNNKKRSAKFQSNGDRKARMVSDLFRFICVESGVLKGLQHGLRVGLTGLEYVGEPTDKPMLENDESD